MSLIIKPTYDPRSGKEVKLVPTTSQGPGPRIKYVEVSLSMKQGDATIEVTVKLNSLEAETLAQGLRSATR